MNLSGNLIKMRSEYNSPVDYYLVLGNSELYLNSFIGKHIKLTHNGVINCVACGKQTNKSFADGYCYACFQTVPMADPSVVNPELSMAQYGIARDMEWAEQHDLIDHFVYLSLTSGVKVGVTRHHQIPTRWIDQGASMAIKLAKTPNRHIAGLIETQLKKHVADKTNWQAMLKNQVENAPDLIGKKNELSELLHPELQKYLLPDNQVTTIEFPGNYVPETVASLSFDKQPLVEGVLARIKGQYLIFDNNKVINIRKHSGYYITFEGSE
jgi:hypothetical protein